MKINVCNMFVTKALFSNLHIFTSSKSNLKENIAIEYFFIKFKKIAERHVKSNL